VLSRQASAEDIAELRGRGIEVYDDDEPAPENSWAQPSVGEWFTPTICPRRANSNIFDHEGEWKGVTWDEIGNMSELDLFRMTFPEFFILKVIIPATNHRLATHMTLQEFYVWLGCNFFTACFPGIANLEDWWSTKPISMWEGAPFRLNKYMAKARFLQITAAVSFTNREHPTFLDKFHDVRQMLEEFNKHYEGKYSPSWINCLDQSMSTWPNSSCPGFIYFPQNHNPNSGNLYHSIADGDQDKPILWRIKLQEGKDRPKDNNNMPQFPSDFEQQTTTSALMLEITKPIHHTGKVIIMNSRFCVTAGILALHDVGVFGQALIKKYGNFWPQHVPGQQIDDYMRDKPLGYAATLKQIVEGKEFMIHCQNDDQDTTTKIMSTHGIIQPDDQHIKNRFIDGDWKSFRYVEPLSRHNQSKHWVNGFNKQRRDPVCLEDVWTTSWWPIRQFTFLCSIAEVNAINSRARARKENADPLLAFRRKLAMDMMENQTGANMPSLPVLAVHVNERAVAVAHEKKTRPTHTGVWDHAKGTWKATKTPYVRLKCAVCKIDTRMYCACNPAVPLCERCYYNHEAEHNSQM